MIPELAGRKPFPLDPWDDDVADVLALARACRDGDIVAVQAMYGAGDHWAGWP